MRVAVTMTWRETIEGVNKLACALPPDLANTPCVTHLRRDSNN